MQQEFEYESVSFEGGYDKPKRIPRELRVKVSNEVPEVIKHTVDQALKKLKISGCAYKVMLSDGTVFEHKAEMFDARRRKNTDKPYKHGAIKEYYEPYIKDLDVGGVASIPCTEVFDFPTIQGSLTAHLSQRWGAGNYTTFSNKTANTLEVMRLG